MKHVKVFENFTSDSGKYLLGFFADGGIGSHPGILTDAVLIENGFTKSPSQNPYGHSDWFHKGDDYIRFHVMSGLDHVPQATAWRMTDGIWHVSEVPLPEAEEVATSFGTDIYPDMPGFQTAVDLMTAHTSSGGKKLPISDPEVVNFILRPRANVIYWSDEPEKTHGYWESGNPISLPELLAQYESDDDDLD